MKRDFPGGIVDKNLPANAGDTGSIDSPGISHIPWSNQDSRQPVGHNYWTCAREPMHLDPVLSNKRSHRNEKPMHPNEE